MFIGTDRMFCAKSIAILIFAFTAVIVSSDICDNGSICCRVVEWKCQNTTKTDATNVIIACNSTMEPITVNQMCAKHCSNTKTLNCQLCDQENCTCYNCSLKNDIDSDTMIIIIASSVGGGGVVVIIIIVAVICCCCRWNRKDQLLPESLSTTAMSQIKENVTGALQASITNENVSKAPSRSLCAAKCAENQTLREDFVEGIIQQNQNVLRYAKHPSETSTKHSQLQESCDHDHRVYENINMAKTPDLAQDIKSDLSKRLEAKNLECVGTTLKVNVLKKKIPKLMTDQLDDDDLQDDYVEMNNSLEQDNYQNLAVSFVGGSEKYQGKVEKTESKESRPKVAIKPLKKLNNAGQNKTLESNNEVKDYENATFYKKVIGSDWTKSVAISTAIKCKADKNERKQSDSDPDDYENAKGFKKKTLPKKITSQETKKNTFSKSEDEEIDSDKEDYENANVFVDKKFSSKINEIKKATEVKAGIVETKRQDSKNKIKMEAAPENNVTIKPVNNISNDAPYANVFY